MIALVLLIALGQADAGTPELVDVQSSASPRATIDAEAGTDLLVANSVNTDVGSGAPADLTALELGLRARVYATAFSGHAHVDIDYQGRQPIFGSLQNSTIHLLYKAEVSADFLNHLMYVGIGRFLAPSAVMLPVDGFRAQVHLGSVELQVFGGRRAITSTRTGNVELGTFLPAFGGSVSLLLSRVTAEAAVAFARDQVVLNDSTQSFDGLQGFVRATGRPFDWLMFGAEVAAAQRASYVLGPTWTDVELRARTVDFFYAVGYLELRPFKSLRLGYDFHFQNAYLFREGLRLDPADPQVTADAFTPRFIDNRVRIRWRPLELGWLGPELRLRIRPDWNEWRFGGNLDLAPDWAMGVCVRASVAYEKVVQTGAVLAPADHSYWSASVGFRRAGLDLALGASNVQRALLPIGSRTYTPYNDTPLQPTDLSPFMLEAQRIAFLRAFYGSDIWFAGLDFEQSLTDPRERRVFAQLGARLEHEW